MSATRSTADIENITKKVVPIAKRYGVERIYLFGSFARGENGADSDVDLRIDKGRVRGLEMAALMLDLEAALGRKVDILSTKALDENFLNSIREDERLIYEAG